MMSVTILLTGKSGQIGNDLLPLLSGLGQVVAPDRGELDLQDSRGIRRVVSGLRPQVIVNAAAYTQVDRAESEPAAAYAVNAEAPGVLAEEARKLGAALVHFSTDYVFDGTKRSPYVEADAPSPLNVYGKSKLEGERAIRASGAPHLILRTSWVYAPRGHNFLLTILRLAAEQEEIRIVSDQIGAPTRSREIAAGAVRILRQIGAQGFHADSFSRFNGVYHMTAGGETSWFDFANAILLEGSNAAPGAAWITAATGGKPRIVRQITPITTAQYPAPARRPPYSVLSNERLFKAFGFHLPDWRTQLRDLFQRAAPRDAGNA